MNLKRCVLASLAAFAVIFMLDMIVHGHLLMGLYTATKSVWRPMEGGHQKMWLMMLGKLVFAKIFVWIYTMGYEDGKPGLGQGLRYGFLVGLLVSVSYVSVWYVVLPVPFALALGWVASGMADCIAAGAVVGLIYRR